MLLSRRSKRLVFEPNQSSIRRTRVSRGRLRSGYRRTKIGPCRWSRQRANHFKPSRGKQEDAATPTASAFTVPCAASRKTARARPSYEPCGPLGCWLARPTAGRARLLAVPAKMCWTAPRACHSPQSEPYMRLSAVRRSRRQTAMAVGRDCPSSPKAEIGRSTTRREGQLSDWKANGNNRPQAVGRRRLLG